MPTATSAAKAAITKPIGPVKTAIAAPKAAVTVAPTPAAAFHNQVAAVATPVATASAILAAVEATQAAT